MTAWQTHSSTPNARCFIYITLWAFPDGSRRRDLNDPQALADTAAEIGLEHDDALAVVSDERYAQAVREVEHAWISRGVHGVPAMIFDKRYLLTGAQGVENYASVLRQVVDRRAA